MGDIVVEALRVVLGTQNHTNIMTMNKAMMEVVGGFCESPEERPLSCCGVEACEKGRAQEDFPLRSFQLPIESTKGNNSSTKGNQVKRQ